MVCSLVYLHVIISQETKHGSVEVSINHTLHSNSTMSDRCTVWDRVRLIERVLGNDHWSDQDKITANHFMTSVITAWCN